VTRRLIPALLAAGLLPLATAPAVAASPDRSQPAPRAAAQVRILDTTSPFSPNGDGHHDRVAVRYRLTAGARVSVEVTHRGKTVLRTAPKATHAGKRSFRWDGTRANGKHVADGRYRVVVRATAHGSTRADATRVAVRTTPSRPDAGTLKLSSATVYPYASVIDDVVVGNVHLAVEGAFSDAAQKEGARVLEASRAQVLDARGHVIAVERLTSVPLRTTNYIDGPIDCGPCARFTWDGRDSDGARQPVGTYRIRVVHGRDAAGNLRLLTGTQPVTVSGGQLVEKTTVLDLLAADATPAAAPATGCAGCDIGLCSPASSTRFAAGLTYDLSRPGCTRFAGAFTVPVAERRTPYDWFDVSATGGPSTAGATASGALVTGATLADRQTYPMNGDTTVSAGRHSMSPNSEVYPAAGPLPVSWGVMATTGSYDFASFKVEIHTYVPAA